MISKMLAKMSNTEDDSYRLYKKHFEGFVHFRNERRRFRTKVTDMFTHLIFRLEMFVL